LSSDGQTLFVSDENNHKIKRVEVSTGTVTTLAGSTCGDANGVGITAKFKSPIGLATCQGGDALVVTEVEKMRLRCVTLESSQPEMKEVPPSTMCADLRKMAGDASMPRGTVTFLVGPTLERFEHIAKPLLCVRSAYFDSMLRFKWQQSQDNDIEIEEPDTTPAAFETLWEYLSSDTLQASPSLQHALNVLTLARKYCVARLEALVLQSLQAGVSAESVVPLLDAVAGSECDEDVRLFEQCRHFILSHSGDVVRAGALDDVHELSIAKGLLGDSWHELSDTRRERDDARRERDEFKREWDESRREQERWRALVPDNDDDDNSDDD